jgi:proline iminopeptidase
LYVEEEGEGMPVVLLHGGPGGTHHSFHPHFSQAREFARVIYYDQRGCGLSDYTKGNGYTVDQAVEDLENLRQSLKIDKWIVLGWSYGGLLGQCYTMKYPESVMGLVLMTAEPALQGQLGSTRQYDYLTQEERNKINEFRVKYFTEQISMEQLIYNAHLNGDWKRQNYYKPTMEELACGALYEWQHDEDFNTVMSQDAGSIDLSGAFESCPIPTLILEAKWDLTWNADKPEKIHKNHPRSKLIIFEKSGHSPFKDEPERFFKVLREFVEQLSKTDDADIARWKDYLDEWKK